MARVTALFSACGVAAIPVVSFLVSILAGFTPTVVLFLIAGLLDIIVSIVLCSKKRFAAMNVDETEVITSGEEVPDITAG